MSISVGLIESKGLVALIEAADVILKNSPVKIVGIHKLENGLVSLAISGNADYIEAAIESGVSAGQKVGEIYSYSIVHNPARELLELFTELYPENKIRINKSEPFNILKESNLEKKDLDNSVEVFSPSGSQDKKIKTSKPARTKVKKQSRKTEEDKTETTKEILVHTISEIAEPQELKTNDDNSVIDKPLSTIERLRKEALGIKTKKSKNDNNSLERNEQSVESSQSNQNRFESEIDFKLIETMNVHKLRNYARSFPDFPIKGRQISIANRIELVEFFKKLKSTGNIEE